MITSTCIKLQIGKYENKQYKKKLLNAFIKFKSFYFYVYIQDLVCIHDVCCGIVLKTINDFIFLLLTKTLNLNISALQSLTLKMEYLFN